MRVVVVATGSFSHRAARAVFTAQRLCSAARACRALSGGGCGAVRLSSPSSLHRDPGYVEDGCSRIGNWASGLPGALDGLPGQSALG